MAEIITFMLASMILLIIILVVLVIVRLFNTPSSDIKSKRVKSDLSKIKRQIDDERE